MTAHSMQHFANRRALQSPDAVAHLPNRSGFSALVSGKHSSFPEKQCSVVELPVPAGWPFVLIIMTVSCHAART